MTATALRVISPGPRSSVQDAGRRASQRYGVSVSGALDGEALMLGNRLVGNQPDAAAIEVTFGAAEFEFLEPSLFALTGADLGATLDGQPCARWHSLQAPTGARITFASPVAGMRSYLCVAGGIDTSPVLGSRSTHVASKLGGVDGSALKSGDVLPIGQMGSDSAWGLRVPASILALPTDQITLRVIPGPQEGAFSARGVDTFYGSTFTVSDRSDRQGVRLDGPIIESEQGRYDIVSDAVAFGSVQVPGDGKPIVLLADRQTTGGYAKIGVVASVDLPLLAQAGSGATIRFSRISVEAAQTLARNRRTALASTPLELSDHATEFVLKPGSRHVRVRLAMPDDMTVNPVAALTIDGGLAFTAHIERIA